MHGCGADALALCASLFENLVDLLYVRQEPEPRASAYIAFEQVDKYYQARKVLRHTDLTEEERKTHEAHLNSLTPQVEKHLGMFPTQSCWWKSSGKSSKRARVTLRDRAEAVGIDKRYDTLYYIFCSHKHPGFGGSRLHVPARGRSRRDPRAERQRGLQRRSALNDVFLDLCGVFQDVYKLGMETEVKALIQKVTET